MAPLYTVVLALILSCRVFAVTVIPSILTIPKPYVGKGLVSSERDFFFSSDPSTLAGIANKTQILLSSHPTLNASHNIYTSPGGFVHGAIDAFVQHQHFVIRPDDVWFTILVQMNFYMEKHGDDTDVRSVFVNHQGKQQINLVGYSLYKMLQTFQFEIQKRVKTDWLLDWIQPRFSTSTEHDDMMANVLMMGLMKSYFSYSMSVPCGLPSITLLGSQQDWKRMLEKLERFPSFGKEPEDYSARLRPILSRFVKTFDAPNDPEIREFWSNTVMARTQSMGCSGERIEVDGWITGFNYWSSRGNAIPRPLNSKVKLDGIYYQAQSLTDMPSSPATLPIKVKLAGDGEFRNCTIATGMMGKTVKTGAPAGYADAMRRVNFTLPPETVDSDHGSLQPVSAWFLYDPLSEKSFPEPKYAQEDLFGAIHRNWGTGQCMR